MRRKLLALLFLCATTCVAQVWYRFGDNPRWGSPDFDDNAWSIAADGRIPPGHASDGILWVRARIRVPADYTEPGAVMWPQCGPVSGPAELFLNGVRVSAIGRMPPHDDAPAVAVNCVSAVPAGLLSPGRVVTVSIRTARMTGRATSPMIGFRFGSAEALRQRAAAIWAQRRLASMGDAAIALLVLLLGVGVWVFWRAVAPQRILFWSAAWLFVAGWGTLEVILTQDGWIPWWQKTFDLYGPPLWGVSMVIMAELLWAANGLSRSRILWLIEILLAGPTLAIVVALETGSPAWMSITLFLVPVVALISLGLALWSLRRPGDARIAGIGILAFSAWGVFQTLTRAAQSIRLGPFDFDMTSLSMEAASFGVAAMLLRRAWTESHKAARLNAEIAAAREIQSSLMPAQCPQVPGFSVEAVYVPASEVGGDFYQVLPCDGGTSLIAVGDVSGKGLKAAMVASLVTGVIQSSLRHSSDPAVILRDLNAVLTDQLNGGFVTCCCVRLEPDGAYSVANAGHVPPYVGGVPLGSEAGLPLGVARHAHWDTTSGFLRTGEKIVLISDGVVEARRPGGELYGFERVDSDMSRFESATDLAGRARQFGQEDDITVVSVQLDPRVVHAR